MPLRWPYARDCNPYPTDYRLTALRRLWAGSSADDINPLQRLARLQGGALAHGTPPSEDDQCALLLLLGPGTEDRS